MFDQSKRLFIELPSGEKVSLRAALRRARKAKREAEAKAAKEKERRAA